MTLGTGVVLFVIGAILAFAVHVQNAFISLTTAGTILMAAGVVVFVIGLVLALRGRRTVTTSRVADPTGAPLESERVTRSSDPAQY
jgi:protein-S-isoprenylcysteine O-methyltransferase Ste14